MKLTHWPELERPREKLLSLGPGALSDAELLAIFFRTGLPGSSAVELARAVLAEFGSLRGLIGASQNHFCQAKGLGLVKYTLLQASLEISRRYLSESLKRNDVFGCAQSTRSYLVSCFREEKNEVFGALFLDAQHRLIQFDKLFFGTINEASVYPRVLVQKALQYNAAAVILTHNHPSGVAEPSHSDRLITNKLKSALALVDVKVLDHIVVGDGSTVSFCEREYL